MKQNLIIPILLVGGVAVYLYNANSGDEKEKLTDDPKFRKGFAAGFITPGPGTFILLLGGGYYIYKNR